MNIYLVGGAVRDRLLGRSVKERDWVVVGATAEELLEKGYKQVGKNFPVFLHPQTGEEYALARTEKKIAPGHCGFSVDFSVNISLEEDLKRRDLSINAIACAAKDLPTLSPLIDPYKGREDLKNRLLRHVSPAFSEDPLRVLRVARLRAELGRFGFEVTESTLDLMQKIVTSGELSTLPPARIWAEIKKAFSCSHPWIFMETLQECGALQQLFPEIESAAFRKTEALQDLRRFAQLEKDGFLRWARFWRCLTVEDILTLGRRLKVSRSDLKKLQYVCKIGAMLKKDATLTPEKVIELYEVLNAFHEPENLRMVLCVWKDLRRVENKAIWDRLEEWLSDLRQLHISSQELDHLKACGYPLQAIGEKLKQKRLDRLSNLIRNITPPTGM